MPNLMHASRVYQAASAKRGLRDQEADIFRRATGALRAAHSAGPIERVRALADNQRLWNTVRALVRDPDNRLHDALKGELISVAMAVQREMDKEAPDFEFLIAINENITGGLSSD